MRLVTRGQVSHRANIAKHPTAAPLAATATVPAMLASAGESGSAISMSPDDARNSTPITYSFLRSSGVQLLLVNSHPKNKTTIKNEAANKLRNDRGTVAMARTAEPNSATAQFFINVKNNAALDYGVGGPGYAVFGTVIEGMDVVDRIVAVPTTSKGGHQDVPVTPVVIQHARVEGAAHAPAGAPAESIEKPAPARPASMPRRN